MTDAISFVSAATLSLDALADLFTRSFEGYFYPGVTTTILLSRRVRTESIDLLHSPIVLLDDTPVGVALIARRDRRAWCGGFGITAPVRGRGLANALAAEMLVRARAAGAAEFRLEVLTRNHVALKVYERIGLRPLRRLRVLVWRPDDDTPQPDPITLTNVAPADLVLNHFSALHPVSAAWQREPASLLSSDGAAGLALIEAGQVRAYAIVGGDQAQRRILDFAAADAGSADTLLAGLQAISSSLVSVNEPAESPLTAAFARAGFRDADEQHEMVIDL